MKVFVTGGARSGKTRFALDTAQSLGEPWTYVATAEALDAEMAERIRRHREERPPAWRTIEEPLAVPELLDRNGVVLVDCLTLWVSNLLARAGEDGDIDADLGRMVEAFREAKNPVVAVSNEVGMGIVPESPLARRFRDELGTLSQRMAAAADRVVLLAAGLPVQLK